MITNSRQSRRQTLYNSGCSRVARKFGSPDMFRLLGHREQPHTVGALTAFMRHAFRQPTSSLRLWKAPAMQGEGLFPGATAAGRSAGRSTSGTREKNPAPPGASTVSLAVAVVQPCMLSFRSPMLPRVHPARNSFVCGDGDDGCYRSRIISQCNLEMFSMFMPWSKEHLL